MMRDNNEMDNAQNPEQMINQDNMQSQMPQGQGDMQGQMGGHGPQGGPPPMGGMQGQMPQGQGDMQGQMGGPGHGPQMTDQAPASEQPASEA